MIEFVDYKFFGVLCNEKILVECFYLKKSFYKECIKLVVDCDLLNFNL